MFRQAVALVMSTIFVISSTACSIGAAARQPAPANLDGLGIGVPRQQVITQLGPPKFSDTDPQGKKQDSFEFQSGMHQGSKARIILYVFADLITLGLAELILWPLELSVMESATCTAVAGYDPSMKVETWAVGKKGGGAQGC